MIQSNEEHKTLIDKLILLLEFARTMMTVLENFCWWKLWVGSNPEEWIMNIQIKKQPFERQLWS